ncbi:hypothetical protein [Gorillibacterium timonense]|uniref:hypothetical protein n=1 Tax=Gorillibacterium timonense TaxID=1689269 RepID=UPI00071E5BB2|nr:hypothetical protein [Gorillibacterium timonense]
MEGLTFTNLVARLIDERTFVTVGTSGSELHGMITAFDQAQQVITYKDMSEGGSYHFIPLSSIRSIGYDNSMDGVFCYIDLFKK